MSSGEKCGMRCIQREMLRLGLIAFCVVSCSYGYAEREYGLSLSIDCAQEQFRRGDEIPIIFTVTNNDAAPYSYDLDEHDRSGRVREYSLLATYQDGTEVPDPREDYVEGIGGGLSSGMGEIGTGGSYKRTVVLNRWALIKEPGRYSVVGTYSYGVPYPDSNDTPNVRYVRTVKVESAPIEVVVSARSDREMGEYIEGLVKELGAIEPSGDWDVVRRREAIIHRLAYTCDERIVPTLLDLIYSNHHKNEVFDARETFLCYLPKSANIKESLLHAARTRGMVRGMEAPLERYGCSEREFKELVSAGLASDDPEVLAESIVVAQDYPDDAHMPRLIDLAQGIRRLDPEHRFAGSYRNWAIHAIAYNRTDDGIRVLKALLESPDEEVRDEARGAIYYAYRRHPVRPKVCDQKLTAELAAKALETDHPSYYRAVVQICQTRTEEGVEALKILAEDPNREPAILETDAGVGAIRDLMRHREKEVRESVRAVIKTTYRQYRGRPLRADDFPAELRERPRRRSSR